MRIIKVISCALLCAFIIICSCLPALAVETAEPETEPPTSDPNFKLGFNYDGFHFDPVDFSSVPDSYSMCVYMRNIDSTSGTLYFYDPNYFEFSVFNVDGEPNYAVLRKNYSSNSEYIPYFFYASGSSSVVRAKSYVTASGICVPWVYNFKPQIVFSANFLVNIPSEFVGTQFTYEPNLFSDFIKGAAIGWTGTIPDNPDIGGDDRPEGDYQYAIYQLQGGEISYVQYFKEEPTILTESYNANPPEDMGIGRYKFTALCNRYQDDNGEIKDRWFWDFWFPENKSYIYYPKSKTNKDLGNTPASYEFIHDPIEYGGAGREVKFSWVFDSDFFEETSDYYDFLSDGNLIEGDPVKPPPRPSDSKYPYCIYWYVNDKLNRIYYFSKKPETYIFTASTDGKERQLFCFVNQTLRNVNYILNNLGKLTGDKNFLDIFNDYEYFPKDVKGFIWYADSGATDYRNEGKWLTSEGWNFHLEETTTSNFKGKFKMNFEPNASGSFTADDVNKDDLYYQDPDGEFSNGGKNDDEFNDIVNGGSSGGDGFDFGDFEFNSDSLWKYANEFLNFCSKTFAVLPSFIWQIIATGAVIVVILRILGR